MLAIYFLIAVSLGYYLLREQFRYWKKKGVPGPPPRFLFGNIGESFLLKKSLGVLVTEIYRQYEGAPFVGIFKSTTPCLILRDPEVIRDVTVKEFKRFEDNDIDIDMKADPLFGRNPFCLKGATWKKVRSQVTPCFTSGKMKALYPIIENTNQRFMKFIEDKSKSVESVEAKSLCIDYTLENVASSAFGLKAKCFEDPENSEFKKVATRFFSPGGWGNFKFFAIGLVPALSKLFSIQFTPGDVQKWFQELVAETLKYRKDNNIVRNDFLDFMVQQQNAEFTHVDITAHATGFLGDGFKTSAIVLSFLLYELAANPEAQKNLRKNVNERFEANGGKLSYEEIMGMPYLDAVFNESQRMHPVLFFLSKVCTAPYTYTSKPDDGLTVPSVTIEKGTPVFIPTFALQNDPKHFSDPERFVPERFLANNKESITKYTFMPFGEGPRVCLGQRFGVLQVKAAAAYVIKHFEMSVGSKTQLPLKFDHVLPVTLPVGGMWIRFKKIIET